MISHQILSFKLFDGFHPELLFFSEASDIDVLAGILESQVLDLVGELLLVGDRELQVWVDKVFGNLKE